MALLRDLTKEANSIKDTMSIKKTALKLRVEEVYDFATGEPELISIITYFEDSKYSNCIGDGKTELESINDLVKRINENAKNIR